MKRGKQNESEEEYESEHVSPGRCLGDPLVQPFCFIRKETEK